MTDTCTMSISKQQAATAEDTEHACICLIQMGGNPFGVPNMDAMAAFGFPGHNMNPQVSGFVE